MNGALEHANAIEGKRARWRICWASAMRRAASLFAWLRSSWHDWVMNRPSGTYRLTKYGYVSKKDQTFQPISNWYSGVIHYGESGYMSAIVRFAEKPEEFEDVVAYSGTYKIEGEEIVHNVTMSVRPSYEGQVLSRKFRLEGRELVTEFENTDEFIKFARWERE